MRWAMATLAMAATGCFRGDLPEVPQGTIDFAPEVDAPEGVTVQSTTVDLACPDDALARMMLVRPAQTDGAIPMAIVFHSGAFDYVLSPDPEDPLAGPHHAEPSRLGEDFAVRQVFATMGMGPEPAPDEVHTGVLVAELVSHGVGVLLPTNCWGDLWGARSGGSDSDVAADFFRREGKTMAEWAIAALLDGTFADTIGATLPVQVDPRRVYGIGLGSGGRAVIELMALDRNDDGVPDYSFAGIVLDGSPDDLSSFVDDPGFDLDRARGVARIFPDGDVSTGSIATLPSLPERVAYLYASSDPQWPDRVHASAVQRLQATAGTMVMASPTATHVSLNGAQPAELTAEVVEYLLE